MCNKVVHYTLKYFINKLTFIVLLNIHINLLVLMSSSGLFHNLIHCSFKQVLNLGLFKLNI